MRIIDNKAIAIRTRNPGKFGILPTQFVQPIPGGYEVVVPWKLDEARVLKNMGVKDVPSPIRRKYNWPGRYTPMEHQKTTAGFTTLHRRGFIFNDPGTAKTISVLWAMDYLMTLGEVRRCLVICPMSIMHSAWMGDINKSVIHRSAIVAHHDKASRRIEMIQGDYEIVIINYDGVHLVADEINANGKFDMIIVDEANCYGLPTTRRWKALAKIIRPDTFLWMMTGTPAAQSPVNAYGMAKLVNPSAVPNYITAWRDKVMLKISTFKWIPKPEAKDIVFKVLQPAIRFTKAQCLDLPPVLKTTREVELTPQQAKYYKLIKDQMLATVAGETISAVNKAAVVNKLLQISCIEYNTPVLTGGGWVPIQQVRPTDLIWDGVEFVEHEGLIFNGHRETVECHGVRMTHDHKVLTTSGWHTAQEVLDGDACAGLNRQPVRLPDGVGPSRYFRWENEKGDMAVQVRLWARGSAGESVFAHETSHVSPALRMSARQQNARNVTDTRVHKLAPHAATVYGSSQQGLAQLRRTWYHGLQTVARFVRGVLAGHGTHVQAGAYARSCVQFAGLQQGQLSVGNNHATECQQAHERAAADTERTHDVGTGRKRIQTALRYVVGTSLPLQLAATTRVDDAGKKVVFDIKNCGPRHQFVVQGRDGQPLIVHNCGAVYTEDKEVVEFDATPRMNLLLEILAETERKVIIFALYRSSIDIITQFLEKNGHAVGVIHGDVTATKRGDIINRFQNTPDPHVLVMQPQATAHGITLTAADTVVFFGPLMSVEQYVQCIARADRQGQTSDKVTVIHIQSSPIEKKMFAAMDNRTTDHALLTQMFDAEMEV